MGVPPYQLPPRPPKYPYPPRGGEDAQNSPTSKRGPYRDFDDTQSSIGGGGSDNEGLEMMQSGGGRDGSGGGDGGGYNTRRGLLMGRLRSSIS